MVTRNCAICGAAFDAPHGQKTCSPHHRQLWKLQEQARRKREERRAGGRLCCVCGNDVPHDTHWLSKTCSQDCQRTWRRARGRENKSKNKRKISEQQRARRLANLEHHRERGRLYNKRKNREQTNAWFRDWYARNPEKRRKRLSYAKRWRKQNPERTASYANQWRARRKGAGGRHTAQEARDLLKHQKYRCAFCRADLRKTKKTRDHIIPLSKGGTDDIKNIQWLCQRCNSRKNAKDPLVFARENGLLL